MKWLLVLFLTGFAECSLAGWSSNGADYARDQNNPWFLGTSQVKYCIRASTGHKLPVAELTAISQETISDWQTFFRKYGLDVFHIGDGNYPLTFLDGKPRPLDTNFVLVPDCHAEQGDIEIFFGLQNSIITDAIQQGGHHGAGLAVRSDYDHATFRNGGYVWIDDFSADRNKVKHMLLHEIGHVFGMKHNSVAVMDEKIADWLFNPAYDTAGLGLIENSYWKYRLDNGESLQFFVSPVSKPKADAEGYVSSSSILPSLRELMGIPAGSRFKADLIFLRFAAPLSIYYYQLRINTHDNLTPKVFDLRLREASNQHYDQWAQGVYTKWLDKNSNEKFDQVLLDLNLSPRTMIGSITVGAQNMAATLNLETGVELRVFEPTLGNWWEIK
jgi:hypothetical protein